jgi:transcriptional regulator with GAF, ATPase, and Fis domain
VWDVTKALQTSGEMERDQIHRHQCPSREAYATGEVVMVSDLREESTRWPEFSASARGLNVVGVAAVSMRLDDKIIGTLNLYPSEPREWSDRDMAVTWVLAEVATNYVVNASMRRQQEQLSQQLQESLDSRVVIEQASEITGRRYWTIGSISTTHALVEAAAASAVSVTDGPR